MIIKGIVIKRAKTILNKIRKPPIHEEYFERMLQIYNCRILGLCIYRTEDVYKKLRYEILNEASTESQTLDQHEKEKKTCGDCKLISSPICIRHESSANKACSHFEQVD